MSTESQQVQNGINGHKDLDGLGGTTDLPPADGPHKQQNAWSSPGPAAFDFRSIYSQLKYIEPQLTPYR